MSKKYSFIQIILMCTEGLIYEIEQNKQRTSLHSVKNIQCINKCYQTSLTV